MSDVARLDAEHTLEEIFAVIAHLAEPESDLDDREAIAVIAGLLERYGMKFVADDAFERGQSHAEPPS